MLGIKRLDHVCWAVASTEKQLSLLTGLFGMKVDGRWRNEEQGYAGVSLEVPGGNASFELLEPTSDDSFIARFLRERGPGLHHVTFEVHDIERTAAAIREYGIEPWGGVRRSHGWAETYIHPRDSGGVLFQFYVEEEPHEHSPK